MSSCESIEARVDAVEHDQIKLRTDLTGEHGGNGKIGNLGAQVRRQWWLLGILLATALSAGTASVWNLIDRGKQEGSDHARVERNERDLEEIRQRSDAQQAEIDTLRADLLRVRVGP